MGEKDSAIVASVLSSLGALAYQRGFDPHPLSLTDRETLPDFNYQPCEVAGCHISPAHSGSSLAATYNNVVQNV